MAVTFHRNDSVVMKYTSDTDTQADGGGIEKHTHTHFPVINETRSCRTTVQFFTTISGTSVTNAATIDYFYSGLIK